MPLPTEFKAHVTGLSYRPSGTALPCQKGSLFLPSGPKPRWGWPVLMHTDFGAWLLSNQATSWSKTGSGNTTGSGLQNDGLPWLCLANGIAVYSFGLTALLQKDNNNVVIAGNGTFKSKLVAESLTQDYAEKDAQLAHQMLVNKADYYGLNASLIGGKGLSSGASALTFSEFSPNMAGQTGYWASGSTRLAFGIFHANQWLYRAIDPTNGSYFHFPQAADVSPYSTVAATVGAANSTWLDDASVLKYGFEDANIAAQNATQRVYTVNDVLPEYFGMVVGNPDFRTTSDNLWNAGAGLTAYTGALGVNGGLYTQNGYHQTHAALLFRETHKRNGAVYGATGALNRTVTSFLAAKKSTWLPVTKPGEDRVIQNTLDFSAEGEMAQDQLDWIRAIVREAA